MAFVASEFHSYYQLKPCSLRVYLRAQGHKAAEPDDYHRLLEKLGRRHEKRHLDSLGSYFDAAGDLEQTTKALNRGESVIYQPAMRVSHQEYGEVAGIPDFFIRDGNEYVIRDCKLSRRFREEHHPEIFRQLELYGWLYEQTFGVPPVRLEAYMGDGQLQIAPYQSARALEVLVFINELKALSEKPFDPIGWSKCLDCGFRETCWAAATEHHDVALLPGVDRSLARALRSLGVTTYDELLQRYDETSLADVKKEIGGKPRRVGNAATRILNHARVFQSGAMIKLQLPSVKRAPNLVMFDVEGIPPHLEHSEKTYLWGLKVFGEKPQSYSAALASVGPDGDGDGWRAFLANARKIFDAYGVMPFVHWSPYEKTQVRKYVEKHGDPDGIAARVLECLYDLQPVVEDAFVLPTSSYGLKVIEQIAGYARMLPEAGGKWSMATYIDAVESDDPAKAAELMGQILQYNEEDLDAMWAVYGWVVAKS